MCEPQLGRRGLYSAMGGAGESRQHEMALLWVLNLSDGDHSLLDIAERSSASFESIRKAAALLQQNGLLETRATTDTSADAGLENTRGDAREIEDAGRGISTARPSGAASGMTCRFCGQRADHLFVDLGMSPLCESFLTAEQLNQMEPFYPLAGARLSRLLPGAAGEYVSPAHIFTEYAYFSSLLEQLGRTRPDATPRRSGSA